ncbi:hypothetical protein Pla108_38030 [Botrimarina colliarenosi]|uniref:DNA ligase (ATP) n=1 Tax=Botrimarina colliarenosi TaxID=2528001 RepID=A0A5C6A4V8_9BACT|nr:hypothetical protein [Botrimarina colliarenosi]TWT94091.1 hypothetical protein Pla108_38030 [Botrimarina colliarenosi]
MSEATLEEDAPETGTATIVAPVESAGPTCEKCGLPSKTAACPRCGWYPSLGIHVEIDEAFETAMNNLPAESGEEATAPKKAEWEKHLEVWSGLIPAWAWMMIATTLACIGAGVAVRVATLGNPTLQMWCGVGGLVGGIALMFVTHVVAFVLCSFDDADFGVADIIIKPLKTWKQIASALPKRVWLANSGNLGVSAALSAALIVGGVPYERLLDWGFKAPPKQNLVGAIAKAAASAPDNGNDSLEGAVGDFAGDAGVDSLAGVDPKPVAEPARERLECLIIGYQIDRDGRIDNFLLATDVGGKLSYVGKVAPRLDIDEERELFKKFEKNTSTRPFVKTTDSGVWLRPRFTCRVTYTEWPKGRRPKNVEWDQLLDEVKLPW